MNLFEYMRNPLTGRKLLDYARQCISENELVLKDIQDSQWEQGEDKLGRVIGRYKKTTQQIARIENPNKDKIAGNPYNLDWTGDLKRKTYVSSKIQGKDVSVTIDSSSGNKPKLFKTIKKHGNIKNPEKTVFGYQEKKLKKVKELIAKELKTKIKENHGV